MTRIAEYAFPTQWGVLSIQRGSAGAWVAKIGEEELGAFATAQQALDALLRGETAMPSCGVSTNAMALPESLLSWIPILPPD